MGTNTYANGNEICSKSSSGKTIAAMPDPCFTPPPTPAGVEVVVPYPNTANASDLDKGSAKVLICNKMAALEKDSCLKTSMGNEAAKPSSMQGGVVTKTTKGKAFFTKWSDDVKFEGKGVCRHVDLTTHNHGSTPGHCVPMPFMSGMNPGGACGDEIKKIESECKATATTGEGKDKGKDSFSIPAKACKNLQYLPKGEGNLKNISAKQYRQIDMTYAKSHSANGEKMAKASSAMSLVAESNPCLRAMRCALQEYKNTDNGSENAKNKEQSCCPGQSGHHIIPKSSKMPACWRGEQTAPVVCVEGVTNTHGTHGKIHQYLKNKIGIQKEMKCDEFIALAAESTSKTFPGCSEGCVLAQLHDSAINKDCPCSSPPPVTAKSGAAGGFKEATLDASTGRP